MGLKFRFGIVVAAIFSAYAFLLFHLYQIQLAKGEYYKARAAAQLFVAGALEARRGIIYFEDKNGAQVAAALNKDFPIIYGVPKDIDDEREVAHQIAPLLGQPAEKLVDVLTKENDPYELLDDGVSPEVAQKIEALQIKGVYVGTKTKRVYPFGVSAAHLLGYVGPRSDGPGESGHYGIEGLYNERLAGVPGKISDNNDVTPSRPGEDIAFTIDSNIQIEAERILSALIKNHDARGGGIIVQEPGTGKILAMAGSPSFDPNTYSESAIGNFLNPMVQKVYEPGSVFKVFTMAIGIESGTITPETTYVDYGTLTMNGKTIQNYDLKTKGPYGKVTMTSVIEHSINTGAVFAQQKIGRDIFRTYLEKFGFNEKTNVGLPGEVTNDIRRLNPKEKDIAFATASYGQGVAVTPLALINGISAIANRGTLMKPLVTADEEPVAVRQVISAHTAQQVAEMMISAIDKAGVAKIGGYTLAGKTGTAFIPDFEKGGYTDKVINTYVGFGPTRDPKFAILIKLDEPAGAPVAALTVVPAFRDLAQFILNYYNIPPDRIGN